MFSSSDAVCDTVGTARGARENVAASKGDQIWFRRECGEDVEDDVGNSSQGDL